MNLLGGPAAFTDLEASKEDRFVFAFFLGLHLRQMEVPRQDVHCSIARGRALLGKLEQQQETAKNIHTAMRTGRSQSSKEKFCVVVVF